MEILKTRELKCEARALMAGRHSFFALATLLVSLSYLMLTYILDYALPGTGGTLNFFLSIACTALVNIVYYLLCAGQTALYLQLCRGGELRLGQLTSAFSQHPEPVAAFAVFQFVIQYAVQYLLRHMLQNFLWAENLRQGLPFAAIAVAAVLFLLWIELGFSFVLFLYCDYPHDSALHLMQAAWALIFGNKWRLFRLMVSFAGVFLLSMLSAGIGFLFTLPYINTAQALFYLNVKAKADQETDGNEAQK